VPFCWLLRRRLTGSPAFALLPVASVTAERRRSGVFDNLHFTVAKGEAITAEDMQAIIDRADADKRQKAIEKLAAKLSS
jgi:hypothetical protein